MENEKNILKWLNGEMSPLELEAFKKTSDYKKYAQIANYSTNLRPEQLDLTKSYADLKTKLEERTKSKLVTPNFKWMGAAAAAVVILLFSTYFIFSERQIDTVAKVTQTKQTQLPDASDVLLNSGSKLSYTIKEWKKGNREVNLEGEAFFKVTKGSDFKVTTTTGVVQVLGTQFNVRDHNDYFEVQCYEGRVRVTFNNQKVILLSGERYRFINGSGEKIDGLVAKQPSWITDESSFDEVPIKYVINELERKYDVKITTEYIDLKQLFTGSFSTTDLEKALKSVAIPLELNFEYIGKKTIRLYAN